jgi:hypothetical protein
MRVKASSGRRAREYGLAGCRNRPDLIFWLLFYQEKSNSLPAANERGQASCVKGPERMFATE